MTDQPAPRDWWSAADLASAALPDLPDTVRGLNALADRQGWRRQQGLARRAKVRGGGWEYHASLLPPRAQARLAAREKAVTPAAKPDRDQLWADWDRLPQAVQDKARARLTLIDRIELLVAGGLAVGAAIEAVSREAGVAIRTLWGWRQGLVGVRADDRLPALAPRHQVAPRATQGAEFDPAAWDYFYSAHMIGNQPIFTASYALLVEEAKEKGWAVPSERTVRRQFDARVPRAVQVLMREGPDALKRLYPPQVRSVAHLHALEVVNADGHDWDVFVQWPDGSVHTPSMCAFQDVHSRMILSWRVDRTPHKALVLRAFGDLVEDWGIPDECVFDNGRDFASKWLTGGTPTRYRFKVREDEPAGVLPLLGVRIHWTTPFSGQSKPIERAFGEFSRRIARHPSFEGAYRGNSPMNKPHNHGQRSVPLAQFLEVVARGVAEHNTRVGRRTEVAAGRSLAEAFAASYETAPIRRATAQQARLWLMAAEDRRGHSESGAIELMDSVYWAPFCPQETAGKRVIVRFDPDDLHGGVHVYAHDGRYIGHAGCQAKGKFLSVDDARLHNQMRREFIKATRAWDVAERRWTAAEVGAMHMATPGPELPAPDAKVIRPMFDVRGNAALAEAPMPAADGALEAWEADTQRARFKVYSND